MINRETVLLGWKWCPLPAPGNTVQWSHSFQLSGLLLILSALPAKGRKTQEDEYSSIIDFHLLLIGEQVCSLFPSNSFHLHSNKYKHPFNLSCVVSTFVINCIFFQTTNHFLVRLSKWKAILKQILWMHQSLKLEILFFRKEVDSEWWVESGEDFKSCKLEYLRLPVGNTATWDGGIVFLGQIQFPVTWPWFSYANSLGFCSFPFSQLPMRKGDILVFPSHTALP